MQKGIKSSKCILVATLCLFMLAPLLTAQAGQLNIGAVTSKPSKAIKTFGPLLKYLNSKGIDTGKVIISKDMKQMIGKIKSGEVGLVSESAYGALMFMDEAGATPFLIRAKKGVKSYNSVVFTTPGSGINSFADLVGKVMAFEDPTSTSSFMLPKNILTQAGFTLVESRKPVAGKIAYYFSKDDDNTLTQVKQGKRAVAGGIKKSKVDGKAAFKLLSPESAQVPRHIVMVHPSQATDNLKAILLGMAADPAAKQALKALKTPTGFFEFDADATTTMNGDVRKALGL